MPQNKITSHIMTVNLLWFIAITLLSTSLFTPHSGWLLLFGAKDLVSIAQGEWYRLITPIFLHIGIIHFVINNMALKVIGRMIEPYLGSFWFLFIYLSSGIAGNISSSYFNTAMGAGASGAIFGLIGVGVAHEWYGQIRLFLNRRSYVVRGDIIDVNDLSDYQIKLIPGPFSSMALLNILFAIFVNFIFSMSSTISIGIDNAAHIGGLIMGLTLGFTFIYFQRYNQSVLKYATILATTIIIVGSSYHVSRKVHVKNLFIKELQTEKDQYHSWIKVNQVLTLDQTDPDLRFIRGKILLLAGEWEKAYEDLQYSINFPHLNQQFHQLTSDLKEKNKINELHILEQLFEVNKPKTI